MAIPTSLHASLLARLDRLAPVREVAQIGAAIARSFSHELISAVAGMPQQKLNEALDQLASAELVFRRGTPPDAEYTFKHAWCRTPPTALCCGADGSNCMAALPRHWKAGFQRS